MFYKPLNAILFFNVCGLLVLSLGCQTASKNGINTDDEGSGSGIAQWEAPAKIYDIKRKRSNSVLIEFVTDRRQRLRMDVTGSFSTPVASAVLANSELVAVMPLKKSYYKGAASAQGFSKSLNIEIEPADLFDLIYDTDLKRKSWACVSGVDQKPKFCQNEAQAIKIYWLERKPDLRRIRIITNFVDLSFDLSRVTTKVQDLEKTFTLNIPPSFKQE